MINNKIVNVTIYKVKIKCPCGIMKQNCKYSTETLYFNMAYSSISNFIIYLIF